MTDPFPVGDIWVVGQRRAGPGQPVPTRGGGTSGGGDDGGGIHQNEVNESDPNEPYAVDPCADPALAPEWNADAAAAEAAKEFVQRAAKRNPPETLNVREWGAALFEMPDGRIVLGAVSSGEHTFQNPGPEGRAGVDIDWTPPPGGVLIGMMHSHNAGSHLPSGSSPESLDFGNLRYIRDVRSSQNRNPDQAKIYIVSLTTRPAGHNQYAKINVYDHRNQAAAISGQEGPEVNPDATPCST